MAVGGRGIQRKRELAIPTITSRTLGERHDGAERVDVHGDEEGGDDPDGPAVDALGVVVGRRGGWMGEGRK